jgi:hypothetical protein
MRMQDERGGALGGVMKRGRTILRASQPSNREAYFVHPGDLQKGLGREFEGLKGALVVPKHRKLEWMYWTDRSLQ